MVPNDAVGTFVAVLLCGIPGLAIMAVGQAITVVTFYRSRESSLLGLRLTNLGFAAGIAGWVVGVTAWFFAQGQWPLAMFFAVDALLFVWLASKVQVFRA